MICISPLAHDMTDMLRLCKEMAALIEWEAEGFKCSTTSEIEARTQRAIRTEELLHQMGEMAWQILGRGLVRHKKATIQRKVVTTPANIS